VRLFVLARHGQSVLNVERRINGDPTLDVPLTPEGEQAARALGHEIANVRLEVCVHTRFSRTRETARVALDGRDVPFAEEPLLDDIDVGELEGRTIDDYRAWKAAHTRRDRFPGGESLDEAAARYARAFRVLLERPEQTLLVVCHEIPIRYALNAAAGSDDLDGPEHEIPNATPFLFDAPSLERAAARMEQLAGSFTGQKTD
jgi:broad specificity phosphatase PhoE